MSQTVQTKENICIICGGKSPEHDVSVVSAKNIFNAIDKIKFNVSVIGISKDGIWYEIPAEHLAIEKLQIGSYIEHSELLLQPFGNEPIVYKNNINFSLKPDVFFPITHGVLGEDGCLQGILEYLNIPYIGPGVLGSAIGMDKDITKKIASLAGIKVSPSHTYYHLDTIDLDAVIIDLGLPLFVKPVNMGSGVGVSKASSKEELEATIKNAFVYDDKILIEKAMKGREVETAVLGNRQPKGTRVGEIIVSNGFYTYENKYVNDSTKVVIPAENLSPHSMEIIQNQALKVYRALQLDGLTRVDFFYENDENIYLNEVNTLPGFTSISMYPKLWNDVGLSFTDLINELVKYAKERYELRNKFKRDL